MARIVWNATGERYFETGVDRGVLYVGSSAGVAWTGLTSVSEEPTGGDPRPFYIDGVKYLNLASNEEFVATIQAFSSPKEFGPCDGTRSVHNGLFVTQQPRIPFSLSYRTKVGNDIDGPDYGYKIHIVYNALAAPSSRSNNSIDSSPEPIEFSWSVSTLPPAITGFKPTAHFVIDSRFMYSVRLAAIEDILYGSDATAPRLPSVSELLWLFSDFAFPPLKAVLVGTNTYEIHEVDLVDARAKTQSTPPTAPASGEDPILWFDTSAGSYSVPKLVLEG